MLHILRIRLMGTMGQEDDWGDPLLAPALTINDDTMAVRM